jgi:hypothetical protein
MSYTEALTTQTFSIIDALYEYGMNELVISRVHAQRRLLSRRSCMKGLRRTFIPTNGVQGISPSG